MTSKALILAAGIGWRLGGGNGRVPKCLLRFGGKTLLQRHLEILEATGVRRVVIGVGYEAQKITSELDRLGGGVHAETVFNPDFERGNIVTLRRMRHELEAGEELLLMDADVLYDLRLIERLVESPNENCFLMDRSFVPGEEPVKLRLRKGDIVEFGKRPDETVSWDVQGESVGFFKLSAQTAARLAGTAERFVRDGRLDAYYEDALRELVLQSRGRGFGVEDVTGLPWIEIDYPEDVTKAERDVFPALDVSLPV